MKRGRIIWALVLLKAAYLGIIAGVLLLWPDMDQGAFSRFIHWPRNGEPEFASHFATWDAAHYLYLSEAGYSPGVPSCAFYPLWPVLIRCFSVVTGGNHLFAGMVLSNVFSLAALGLFYRMVGERLGTSVAKLSLLLLLAFPGSLFFHFGYTESLFFLLLMIFCDGLERNRYSAVWVAAFLLPLTRAVGVFCIFPLIWHLAKTAPPAWLTRWKGPATWLSRFGLVAAGSSGLEDSAPSDLIPEAGGGLVPARQQPARFPRLGIQPAWVLILAPAVGWICYLLLIWAWTGNAFEGFEAQKYWGWVQSISNIFNVPKFLLGFLNPSEGHEFTGSLLDRCVFVLLLNCLPVIWRLDKGWFVWTVVLGVVPAMSGTFTSFTRFASVVFPIFVALAVVLQGYSRRYLRAGVVAGFLILHVILLWRFVNFRWAG